LAPTNKKPEPAPPSKFSVVEVSERLKPLPYTATTSPCGPLVGETASEGPARTGLGTDIIEMEMNSAEVSSTTKNRELDLRVVNLKHTTHCLCVRIGVQRD